MSVGWVGVLFELREHVREQESECFLFSYSVSSWYGMRVINDPVRKRWVDSGVDDSKVKLRFRFRFRFRICILVL